MRDTLSCFQRIISLNNKLVTIAKWIHLFPSRTQKLSTFTPKIVYAKIGSCQFFFCFFNYSSLKKEKIEKLIDEKKIEVRTITHAIKVIAKNNQ